MARDRGRIATRGRGIEIGRIGGRGGHGGGATSHRHPMRRSPSPPAPGCQDIPPEGAAGDTSPTALLSGTIPPPHKAACTLSSMGGDADADPAHLLAVS